MNMYVIITSVAFKKKSFIYPEQTLVHASFHSPYSVTSRCAVNISLIRVYQ